MIVYLPGARGADPAQRVRAGLPEDWAAGASFADTAAGPDGASGALVWWPPAGAPGRAPPRYDPGTQSWCAAKGAMLSPAEPGLATPPCGESPAAARGTPPAARGRFWLGRAAESAPGPADLARPRRQPGSDVLLADGQLWHVPIARQLPHVLGLADDGSFAARAAPGYARFFDAAQRALSQWLLPPSGEPAVRWSDGFEFACQALAINYRLTSDVADWLGLITTETMLEVIFAAVEWDAIRARLGAEKKSEAAGRDAGSTTPATPCT